jgi:hypothetical protein
VDAITGADFLRLGSSSTKAQRNPELEDELIELAYVHFDENFEFIVKLLEYFGDRFDEFDGQWPELLNLLQEIKKHNLESEFYKYLRYMTNKNGMHAFLSMVGGEWSLANKWSGLTV